MTEPFTLLHFALDSDTSGYFPQLAKWRDRTRYRMLFGTLRPMDRELADFMRSQDVDCFSCGCQSRAGYPLGLLRLARLIRQQKVDILHTHLFDPSVVGLLAGTVAGTPVRLLTRHYSDYHTRIGKTWHVGLDRLCTRLATAVIAVSSHTAAHLIEHEGAPPEKVHAILNGIDFDRVVPSGSDARDRIRRELGAEDAFLLLLLARLHPEKGHTFMFRALPGLRRRVRQRFLVLVAGDGPFEQAYRAEVMAQGCEDVVRFLGFRRDAPDLIAAADVLVLPSVAEAFGLVLAEALYLGTPVVATRVGGIPEIVDDGTDGLLVPPADPAALEDILAELLNTPARLAALRGAGSRRIREQFRFEEMMQAYERLYASLLADTRSRR